MKVNNVNYGYMLKLIRSKLGYTQEDLANRLGVNRVNISRYENGEREFRVSPTQMGSLLEMLCGAGYSINEIIDLCKKQHNSFN